VESEEKQDIQNRIEKISKNDKMSVKLETV